MSRIRLETSVVLHLGDTHPDHPLDLLTFALIAYLVVRSNVEKIPIPRLLKAIAQDATYYFLFLFTSHLVVMMFLLFASVRISSQPSTFSHLDLDRMEPGYSLSRE